MENKIAFFIDGGYFTRRVEFFLRKYFNGFSLEPEQLVAILKYIVARHQESLARRELYRVYFYDAPPFDGQVREPVPQPGKLGLRTKNFKNDARTLRQNQFHNQLSKTRKLALRMGELAKTKHWQLMDSALQQLLQGEKTIADLLPEDFHLGLQQKGVDTRLGIDIATLSINRFVDTMVLVASDADFVPAAKLARIHGVDVLLDPLFGNVAQGLEKHIDGKKSYDLVAKISQLLDTQPYPLPSWWAA